MAARVSGNYRSASNPYNIIIGSINRSLNYIEKKII
jgi:hypothetical protein